MGVFKWFERKLFTGDVLQDYGDIQDERVGVTRLRTSVMLCRRKGKLQLVFRNISTAPLGAGAQYSRIDVTPETLERLREIVSDAKRTVESNQAA